MAIKFAHLSLCSSPIWDRDHCTPESNHFRHCRPNCDWDQLYYRRSSHYREQVRLCARDNASAAALPLNISRWSLACRRKEVMRIGDDNLFEIGCRALHLLFVWARSLRAPSFPCTHVYFYTGVESPSVGNFNTISTRARVHHTVRISSYCVIGAGCLVVPTDDEVLDEYTVVYGPSAERRVWSGRGRVQEADLRRKHAEYLRETLPKFNRLRRGDAHGHGA